MSDDERQNDETTRAQQHADSESAADAGEEELTELEIWDILQNDEIERLYRRFKDAWSVLDLMIAASLQSSGQLSIERRLRTDLEMMYARSESIIEEAKKSIKENKQHKRGVAKKRAAIKMEPKRRGREDAEEEH
jgi:hypothetical protein